MARTTQMIPIYMKVNQDEKQQHYVMHIISIDLVGYVQSIVVGRKSYVSFLLAVWSKYYEDIRQALCITRLLT